MQDFPVPALPITKNLNRKSARKKNETKQFKFLKIVLTSDRLNIIWLGTATLTQRKHS